MTLANAVDNEAAAAVQELRDEIAAAMHRRSMTISDLAIACRLSADLVSSIVSGDRIPTTEQLVRIARALGGRWTLQSDA